MNKIAAATRHIGSAQPRSTRILYVKLIASTQTHDISLLSPHMDCVCHQPSCFSHSKTDYLTTQKETEEDNLFTIREWYLGSNYY